MQKRPAWFESPHKSNNTPTNWGPGHTERDRVAHPLHQYRSIGVTTPRVRQRERTYYRSPILRNAKNNPDVDAISVWPGLDGSN